MQPLPQTILINGTGSSNKYKINGVFSPYLHLIPRNTYRFDQSDSSNSGHPLRFYLDVNKGTAYTTGVTTSGTPGTVLVHTLKLLFQIQLHLFFTINVLHTQTWVETHLPIQETLQTLIRMTFQKVHQIFTTQTQEHKQFLSTMFRGHYDSVGWRLR